MNRLFIFLTCLICALPMAAADNGVHRFATFNIRYCNPNNGDTGDKLWANRRQYVTRIVTDYDFDVVGFEEVVGNNRDSQTGKSQLQDLVDMLPDYDHHQFERSGTSYEYNTVFFKRSRYTLLDKGGFYVNEHPSTPGKGWDYSDHENLPRCVAWVHLRDNASGQDFYFATAHTSYGPIPSGIHGAQVISSQLHAIAGQTPIVLVGDFNMVRTSHEEAYRGYASVFYDAALQVNTTCRPKGNITHTASNWYPATSQNCQGSEFDYIFYDHMTPLSREIITEDYNRSITPSDHFPLVVSFKLGNADHPTCFYASNPDELATALSSATMLDTICLAAGDYTLSETIVPQASLTIIGGWNADYSDIVGESTLHLATTGQVFSIPHYYSLTLQNITLRDGKTTLQQGGGLIYSHGNLLSLSRCRFLNAYSATMGGAVCATTHSLSLNDCFFSCDTAKQTGGAVYATCQATLTVHDCQFRNNAAADGAALFTNAYRTADIQCSSFTGNTGEKYGAVHLYPYEYALSANILNCSFLNNVLNAKKGLATVTKLYGGTAVYAKMNASDQVFNIGHCTFLGNRTCFAGTAANFTGTTLQVENGKACMMNCLLLANTLEIAGAEPIYSDYAVAESTNLWRDTYNLHSASADIPNWQSTLTQSIAGSFSGKVFTATVLSDGTYQILDPVLAGYNLCCLPTIQRLCESAFGFDLNGDGTVTGYLTYDQLRHTRAIKSCIGAVEHSQQSTDVIAPEQSADLRLISEHTYLLPATDHIIVFNAAGACLWSGSGNTINLSAYPQGIYFVNNHKVIR